MNAVLEPMVVFLPSGRRGRFAVGTPVLTAARSLGVDLDSVCGGRGVCGRCQVCPSLGQHAKLAMDVREESFGTVTAVETRYAQKRGLAEGRRLGCSAVVLGDVVVEVPPESQVHRPVVRKDPDERVVDVDPVVRLHVVQVAEPDMHHPSGDLQRMLEALSEQWGLADLTADPAILPGLQKALRKGEWTVTAAVRNSAEVMAVWPGVHDRPIGLAVDVGSTTLAAHLVDLSDGRVLAAVGRHNPQVRFGEDVMSRVSHVMMHPDSLPDMIAAVREAIGDLAHAAAAEAGVSTKDILEVTLVGNPIMHHILLGLDPTELGTAPFALAVNTSVTMPTREFGWAFAPGAKAYILPCVAGHVGADAAAAALSEAPWERDEISLIVDVGTNAEIVLGNRDRLLACSSPTGPAFEGGEISCGQRAAPGAVERVRIDRNTLEPRFKVIGSDLWSDEQGFSEAVSKTGVTGICGSGIIELVGEMFLCGLISSDGVIRGRMSERTDRIVNDGRTFSYVLHRGEQILSITQPDLRAIQLAKAALQAGARLLMDRLEITAPDRIVLTGGFGSRIDPLYALVLGMLPDCPLDAVHAVGNAAGTGARIALVNRRSRDELEDAVRRIEKIETAVDPNFQVQFVDAMALPNARHPYPRLATAVSLPVPTEDDDQPNEGRRRRRSRT